MAQVKLRGKETKLVGRMPEVGEQAPDFVLVDATLRDRSLTDYRDKTKLLNVVPSLDTSVCAQSTRRFNELAEEDLVMLMVSADLPFAQKRFCDLEKLKRVVPLSMMRSRKFAKDYGVLIGDGPLAGVTARAVFVLDENDRVVYRELVADIADEPDYAAAMAAVRLTADV